MNDYVERVLTLLGERDPLDVLAATPSRLQELFRELKDNSLGRSYAPDKWTARQILAHLADVEIGYGFRVRQVLTDTDHRVQTFDQDAWLGLLRGIDAALAIEVFRTVRTWNLALYRSLVATQLARVASHPDRGQETVGHMLKLIAGHDLNHLDQLNQIAVTRV